MKIDQLLQVKLNKRVELAINAQAAGQFDESQAIYRAILEEEPEYLSAIHGLGILFVQQGDIEKGEQWLRKAVNADPLQARYWNDLGEALRQMQRNEESMEAYQKAIELNADFAEPMSNLAVLFAGLGRIDEAKMWLEKAVAVDASSPYGHNNLGAVLEALGDIEGALHQYEFAIKFKPDFFEAKENYANLLSRNPEMLMDSMHRLLEEAKAL